MEKLKTYFLKKIKEPSSYNALGTGLLIASLIFHCDYAAYAGAVALLAALALNEG